jgi:hypothetical protein
LASSITGRAAAGLLAVPLAVLLGGAGAQAQELPLPGGDAVVEQPAPAEGATDREVSAELDATQDRAIAERLRATSSITSCASSSTTTTTAGHIKGLAIG